MTRVPPPPSDLSAASKAVWKKIHEGWEVDEAGRAVLATALRATDRAAAARELVKREGLVVKFGKGQRAHPGLQIVKDSELIALKGWRQLGLQGAPAGTAGRPPGAV